VRKYAAIQFVVAIAIAIAIEKSDYEYDSEWRSPYGTAGEPIKLRSARDQAFLPGFASS